MVKIQQLLNLWFIIEEVDGAVSSVAVVFITKESRDCGGMSSVDALFYFIVFFLHMEEEGLLDPSNELHLFCLQYVFIPRINESLSEFCRAWNSHPLSTESNHTPIQLWLAGCHPQEDEVYVNIYNGPSHCFAWQ